MSRTSASRGIRCDERAASEVVGAMMLLVIVTVAAASLGKFIFDEQEKAEEAKALQNAKARELMSFLDIDVVVDDWYDEAWSDGQPGPSSRFDRYKELTFTIQGAHPSAFRVEDVIVNGHAVANVTLQRFDAAAGWVSYRIVRDETAPQPTYDAFTGVESFPLEFGAREKFKVTVNLRDTNYAAQVAGNAYDPDGQSWDFFAAPGNPPIILSDSYVQLEVLTGYFNKFAHTWVPATPVMATPAATAPDEATSQSLDLDAAASYHPYADHDDPVKTIGWDWTLILPRRDDTLNGVTGGAERATLHANGETASGSFADTANASVWVDNCHRTRTVEVVLAVTADNGMVSTSKGTYTVDDGGAWPSGSCPS